MVVAGDHANNDMYGDEPDSWKSQIEALGVSTTGHLNGIGRYASVQALRTAHFKSFVHVKKHINNNIIYKNLFLLFFYIKKQVFILPTFMNVCYNRLTLILQVKI